MINNDFGNSFLKNFFNRGARNESPADIANRIKARYNKGSADAAAAPADDAAAAQDTHETDRKQTYHDIINAYTRGKKGYGKKDADNADASAAQGKDDSKLTREERRQKELAEIMEKIEAEEKQRSGHRHKDNKDGKVSGSNGTASSKVTSTVQSPDSGGVEGFLNDMPLFDEFKTSLMEAFKNMDSGTSGAISAQYELNYSAMQAVANAAGGFEYEETTVSVKFNLNYVKAANGGTSGADIAAALEGATDFASLMDALEKVSSDPAFQGTLTTGNGEAAAPTDADAAQTAKDEFIQQLKDASKPDFSQLIPGLSRGSLQQKMQDYFSPEATAGRILDFATAFFPMSDAYKKGGDTEEARKEFADMMGKAVQKGFDQALGALGTIPKETRAGIDKTHELVFKGFEDFVKNGLKQEKQDTYKALQGLEFNYESTVTTRKVSVSYGQQSPNATSAALDAQA